MRDVIAAMRKNTGKAFAAGVKVAFGTDAAVLSTRAECRRIPRLCESGNDAPGGDSDGKPSTLRDLLGPKYLVGSLEQAVGLTSSPSTAIPQKTSPSSSM